MGKNWEEEERERRRRSRKRRSMKRSRRRSGRDTACCVRSPHGPRSITPPHPSGDQGGGVHPKYTGGSLAGIFLEGCLDRVDSGINPQISLHFPRRFCWGGGSVFGTCRAPEMSLECPLWGHCGGPCGYHLVLAGRDISSGDSWESQGSVMWDHWSGEGGEG